MENKNTIRKELEGISPFLAKLDKENGFKVPEDYFAQLQDQVMAEIKKEGEQEKEKPAGKRISLFHYRIFQAAAAVVAILAVVFLFDKKTNTTAALAEITGEEAAYYLAQNLDDIEEELLFDFPIEEAEEDFLPKDLNDDLLDEILEEYIDEIGDDYLEGLL